MDATLGKKAKDKITGFAGTVTGTAQYLTGCDQCLVLPETADPNKYPEGQWLDINRLEFGSEDVLEIDTSKDKGADMAPPRY